jgi:hemoglobin
MQPEIQQYPFGARPDVTRPNPEFLTFMGEDGIRKLISRHYDLMRQSSISHLFPADDNEFEAAKKRSSDFIIQICGGPDYFNQNRGKPMLPAVRYGLSVIGRLYPNSIFPNIYSNHSGNIFRFSLHG